MRIFLETVAVLIFGSNRVLQVAERAEMVRKKCSTMVKVMGSPEMFVGIWIRPVNTRRRKRDVIN